MKSINGHDHRTPLEMILNYDRNSLDFKNNKVGRYSVLKWRTICVRDLWRLHGYNKMLGVWTLPTSMCLTQTVFEKSKMHVDNVTIYKQHPKPPTNPTVITSLKF